MHLSFCSSKFEKAVRESINVYDRALTTEDALSVVELDLTNLYFKEDEEEDIETLSFFTNLESLSINLDSRICFKSIWDLGWTYCGRDIDFGVFANMKKLKRLSVYGGDDYAIPFKNLDSLIPITSLEYLQLYDFGPGDLSALSKMSQLKALALYNNRRLLNVSAIGDMTWLNELVLEELYVEDLEFLDYLPDSVSIKISCVQLSENADVKVKKWKRFKKRNISEIWKGWRDYIDLSSLDD